MKNPIFYPKLSDPDFHLFRAPGSGLGNLLFPWARAHLYAKRSNGYVISPTWRNFKLGPVLRKEKDFRTYGDIFLHRSLEKFIRELYIKLHYSNKKITEDEYLFKQDSNFIIVEGMKNFFGDLNNEGQYLRNQLNLITVDPPKDLVDGIAMHIRMGDFSDNRENIYRRNSRVEISWFVREAYRLREILGDLSITIFTDDNTGAIKKEFSSVKNINFSPKASAIQDILKISSAKHIVCSNSTFSLWAVFLSHATFSAKFEELFYDYRFNSDIVKERYLYE